MKFAISGRWLSRWSCLPPPCRRSTARARSRSRPSSAARSRRSSATTCCAIRSCSRRSSRRWSGARRRPRPRSIARRSRRTRERIFNSHAAGRPRQSAGRRHLVEFFDYNCGFCRKALADKIELMKADPKLRLVLKEFPVLGEGSTQAAQVAVAVRMQDKTGGKKYFEFHQKMFASRGQIDKARALAVVREIGLDAAPRRKGHGERRGAADARGELQARRGARHQRHADLCGRPDRSWSARSASKSCARRSTPRVAARPPADGRICHGPGPKAPLRLPLFA